MKWWSWMDQEWQCVPCLGWVCVGSVSQHHRIVLLVPRVWQCNLLSLIFWFLIPGDIYIFYPRCSITSRGGNSNFLSGSFFFSSFLWLPCFPALEPVAALVKSGHPSWGGSDGKKREISHHFDIKGLEKTWNGVGCLLPKPVFMGRSGLQHIRHYKYWSSTVNISNLIRGSGNSL